MLHDTYFYKNIICLLFIWWNGVSLKDLSTSYSKAPVNITVYDKRMKLPYVAEDVIFQDFEKCPLSWIIGVGPCHLKHEVEGNSTEEKDTT